MTLKLNGIFRRTKGQDIVHRWEGNPLIGLSDLDFQVSDIHNASAVAFQDQPLLLVTIETLSGQRCVHLARPNKDGIFKVDLKPFLKPSTDPSFLQHEINGVPVVHFSMKPITSCITPWANMGIVWASRKQMISKRSNGWE